MSASHSHNTPTAAHVPGVGELDADYVRMAARQSPKFTGHFPFTAESGHKLVEGMVSAIRETRE